MLSALEKRNFVFGCESYSIALDMNSKGGISGQITICCSSKVFPVNGLYLFEQGKLQIAFSVDWYLCAEKLLGTTTFGLELKDRNEIELIWLYARVGENNMRHSGRQKLIEGRYSEVSQSTYARPFPSELEVLNS